MTDYYWGIAIGLLIGYCLSFITLLMVWALCVVAKGDRIYEQKDFEKE